MVNTKVRISLSRDLRKKYHIRSFPVAKGDVVTVTSGGKKEEGGKVIGVNHAYSLVSIEGLSATKADGKQEQFWMKPDRLQITRIDLSRKDRIDELKRLGSLKKVEIDKDLEEDRLKQEEEARAQEEAEAKAAEEAAREAEAETAEEGAEEELPEAESEAPEVEAEPEEEVPESGGEEAQEEEDLTEEKEEENDNQD